MKFNKIHLLRQLLIVLAGTLICSDATAAAVRVATFGIQLPALISNGIDLTTIAGGATSLFTQFTNAFSEEKIKVFKDFMDAFEKKDYEHLGFTNIGNFFETSVPSMMNSLLGLYPFIRLTVNHVGEPVINLLYDLGGITGSTLAINFCGELKTLLKSRSIERTFAALNDLDNILKSGLLPRISALFAELDGLILEAKSLGKEI